MSTPALQSRAWIMICLVCGIKADELVAEQRGLLVAIQEHAIADHGFTHEEFPHQMRSDVPGLGHGVAYMWSRSDGTCWLLAIDSQQVSEEQIEALRLQYVRTGLPMRLVEVAYATKTPGQRSWAIDSVGIPAYTATADIAAVAIEQWWRDYVAQGSEAVAAVQHVWLHTANPKPVDDSPEAQGLAFDLQALPPALLAPKVVGRVHTDDWAIDLGCENGEGFDATPFFAYSADETLRELMACGFGGEYEADAVADLAEAYDERVAAMFTYLNLPGKGGFECYVDPMQARAWLQCHRPHLLIEVEDKEPAAPTNAR